MMSTTMPGMMTTMNSPDRSECEPLYGPVEKRSNREIAMVLHQVADLLEAHKADHSARAYRRGAQTLESWSGGVAEILRARGRPGLDAIPNIGPKIAAAIDEYVHTGRIRQLDRLRGDVGAEALLQSVGGIGPKLAQQIHEALGVTTLEELEIAAHDGRLDRLPGFGHRRLTAIRHELASMLRSRRSVDTSPPENIPIESLLAIDTEYRLKADAGMLRRIAPRRFNPDGKRWLPLWHVTRDGWDFTALFSNTARAHRLDKTDDWVVIFFEKAGVERQCTVVTEHRGDLTRLRVVRGREPDCRRYYRDRPRAVTIV